jgi:hypothetical protein
MNGVRAQEAPALVPVNRVPAGIFYLSGAFPGMEWRIAGFQFRLSPLKDKDGRNRSEAIAASSSARRVYLTLVV